MITAFVQDKPTIERGLFDEELVPEELTQVRMGKIVKEKFPNLDEEDQEAVRQHAIAALNIMQQAKKALIDGGDDDDIKEHALIDGVRKFAMDVRELDIDLIDRINPFGEAYAILAKSMSEERLKQVAEVIAAKRVSLTLEEARELAKRALRFKQEKGRLPSLTAVDPWEKRMAEGIAFLQQKGEGERAMPKRDHRRRSGAAGRTGRRSRTRQHRRTLRAGSSASSRDSRRSSDSSRSTGSVPRAWRGPRHFRAALCRAAGPHARIRGVPRGIEGAWIRTGFLARRDEVEAGRVKEEPQR